MRRIVGRSSRDRRRRRRILLVKTAAILLSALLVGVIHFWATAWWQVFMAVPVGAVLGVWLRRIHRGLVALPQHRLSLAQRAHRFESRFRRSP